MKSVAVLSCEVGRLVGGSVRAAVILENSGPAIWMAVTKMLCGNAHAQDAQWRVVILMASK